MAGMASVSSAVISDYNNRTVAIEVTAVCRQEVMRTSNWTIKVPYSRMAQTIQKITRMGGKVAGVSLLLPPEPSEEPEAKPKNKDAKS